MKSNLLSEMQQILEREDKMKVTLPIPHYLFVQRYGREIIDDMQEIAELFGQKEWFFFDTSRPQKDGKLLSYFNIELDRHAGLGREYTGSILIELSGEEDEKELEELFHYIDSHKERLHCIYTMKVSEEVKMVRRHLEKYGFVRVVPGEKYDSYEQIEIFQDTLEAYQFQLDEEAERYVTKFFRKREWEETDAVKKRIENIAKELVYGNLIREEAEKNIITKDEVEQVLASLQSEPARKRQIGFVTGGAEL